MFHSFIKSHFHPLCLVWRPTSSVRWFKLSYFGIVSTGVPLEKLLFSQLMFRQLKSTITTGCVVRAQSVRITSSNSASSSAGGFSVLQLHMVQTGVFRYTSILVVTCFLSALEMGFPVSGVLMYICDYSIALLIVYSVLLICCIILQAYFLELSVSVLCDNNHSRSGILAVNYPLFLRLLHKSVQHLRTLHAHLQRFLLFFQRDHGVLCYLAACYDRLP